MRRGSALVIKGGVNMDEFKGRWQALQSGDAGSRLVGGALARSVAECFMAGYQIALDRTFHMKTLVGEPSR